MIYDTASRRNLYQAYANICLFPSYLSLTHALRVYGLILEYVFAYTSARFGKKENKTFVFSPEFSFHKGTCSVISFEYDFHFETLY